MHSPLLRQPTSTQAARNVSFGIMALASGFCQNIQMSKACIKVSNPEWD
jgi:hypothetical protein